MTIKIEKCFIVITAINSAQLMGYFAGLEPLSLNDQKVVDSPKE